MLIKVYMTLVRLAAYLSVTCKNATDIKPAVKTSRTLDVSLGELTYLESTDLYQLVHTRELLMIHEACAMVDFT